MSIETFDIELEEERNGYLVNVDGEYGAIELLETENDIEVEEFNGEYSDVEYELILEGVEDELEEENGQNYNLAEQVR